MTLSGGIQTGISCAKALAARISTSRSKNGAPAKVLVVQMAKLGDMVCTTPMFRAIKQKYPHCEVWVMGDAVNQELLRGHPDVDGYIAYRYRDPSVLAVIKGHNFDFACITGPVFEVLALLLQARVPLVVAPRIKGGWSPYETLWYKLLSKLAVTRPHHMGRYAPREYLRLLEPLGIFTDDTKKYLTYSTDAAQKIDTFLSEKTASGVRIAVSPSAGNKIKNWGAHNFAAVLDRLWSEYQPELFVIGGPRDREEVADTLAALAPETRVIDTSGQFNLDELKAFIARMDMFVAVDTGPIYIAEAFGVSTVDIVGPMDEREQPPIGPRHRIVVPPGRQAPALHIMNARMYDVTEAQRQIKAISIEQVLTAISETAVFPT